MYKKIYSDNIKDMIQACEDIETAIKGINFNEFERDLLRYRSVERLFEILGEAANRTPKELQEKYPKIPWKNIIGMRNIIIHTYERVDISTLWDAAQKDLSGLKLYLNDMLNEILIDEN